MSGGHSEGHRQMGHLQSLGLYTKVFIGLLILTIITVAVSLWDFGFFNDILAVGIATGKASLVILFFMHGRYEGKITWAFIYYPIILLLILLSALYLDYGNRDNADRIIEQPVIAQPVHHDGEGDHGAAPAGDHGDSGQSGAAHGDAGSQTPAENQGDAGGQSGDSGQH